MDKRKQTRNKHKHNKTFEQIEIKIQKVVQRLLKKHPGNIRVKQVADEVGISRQGFYEHYKSVDEAILKGGAKLVKGFRDYLNDTVPDNDSFTRKTNRRVFTCIFLYMAKYHEVFYQICLEPSNHHLIRKMMECAFPKLRITWYPTNQPAPVIGETRADMYVVMAVKIICIWGEIERCDLGYSSTFMKQLLHLTEEASSKCRV